MRQDYAVLQNQVDSLRGVVARQDTLLAHLAARPTFRCHPNNECASGRRLRRRAAASSVVILSSSTETQHAFPPALAQCDPRGGTDRRFANRIAGCAASQRRRIHGQDSRADADRLPVEVHDGARRSSSGVQRRCRRRSRCSATCPGTIGRLSRTEDLNRYFRAVEAASPRVKVFSLGMSEEGREMIIAAVADEATIKRLDDYRSMAARLADPRGVSDAERDAADPRRQADVLAHGHHPLTGDGQPRDADGARCIGWRWKRRRTLQNIRNNVITLITPATEVDGRNRIVDIIEEEKQLKLGRGGIPTVYWGKYIAHDNNRDGLMMSIKLTQNMNAGFLHWRPTIMHDLHESVPFLYTSTGTGPYNDEFDPITVDEWHTLAYQEINELTKRGLPGVWTHGFYDGWAPNYMLGIAQFHNSIGKFYETYTSGGADCQIVNLPAAPTSKEWDRPNPPVNGVKWCIRSNINYQQSGVLVALKYVARPPRRRSSRTSR